MVDLAVSRILERYVPTPYSMELQYGSLVGSTKKVLDSFDTIITIPLADYVTLIAY